jgi:hypothetical protein
MNRLGRCILIAVFVSLFIIPVYVTAASDIPVVWSITGPDSREIVESDGRNIRLSVQVDGGTPPYTYTWLKSATNGAGGTEYSSSDIVYQGTYYSTATFNLPEDFHDDDHGVLNIWLLVTDSKGNGARYYDDRLAIGSDAFVWGIQYGGLDYSIPDEKERYIDSITVYTLPSSFPSLSSSSSRPIQPEETPLSGGLIPVKSCFDEGTRCYGGPDCINGVCVDPCQGSSSPFCQCDCIVTPPESEFPWVVIVGGLAVVAVAAGLIAILRGKPKKKGQQPPEQYILQLSKDTVKVSPQKSDSFTVTAWMVTGEGGIVPVPSALIRAIPPPNIPDLSLDPASGNGSLAPSVSLRHFPGSVTGIITITASAGGRNVSTDVKVTIEGEADIEFD